jgi:hypothetical protein
VNEITISRLLLEHYLEWQQSEGSLKTAKEFCDYIGGIKYANFNHYFTGRRNPGKDFAKLFADRLNDPRFYDAAGFDRPDPSLEMVNRNWENMPDEVRRHIAEQAASYSTKQVPVSADPATE